MDSHQSAVVIARLLVDAGIFDLTLSNMGYWQ